MMKLFFVTAVLFVLHSSTTTALEEENKQLLSQLSQSTSEFSQRLYQEVAVEKSNAIYSPYSINSALAMTSVGARGNTLAQMSDVLGLTALGENASTAYHDLIVQLNSADKVKLHTANALFVQSGRTLDPEFVDDVSKKYFATVTNFDLHAQGGPEKVINDFVAMKTENMIKKILDPGTIDASTLTMLVNTIFFNGTWYHPFSESKTKKQDFHQIGGVKKQVDMMNNEKWFQYKRDTVRKADVLEMPFKNNRFSLNILLPHESEGIKDIEKTLTTDGVDDIFQNLQMIPIKIAIPKFKIETRLLLASTLKKMGMKKAFSPSEADFSGISNQGSFYLDSVIHQAVIEVKETGTVAAAATVIGVRFASAVIPPQTTFIADHPFLFFLRDSQTGQILFQGKYSG